MAGVQIIERSPRSKAVLHTIRDDRAQVSFNDYGHLAVRFFEQGDPDRDVLVVFDHAASAAIVGFCQRFLSKDAGAHRPPSDEDVPF